MEKVRDISNLELVVCDVQELFNPCTVQFLMQFTGNISVEEIEDTINDIVIQTPGINVYKNKNSWINKNEMIKVKDITLEDETNLLKENLFHEPVDLNKRNIELYLLNIKDKKTKYLVFKFFHGVVDARGAILIVQNFINKICGKETYILKNDITNKDIFNKVEYYNKKFFLIPKYTLKKINKINDYKSEWNVITIDKYIQNITAKISKILQSHFLDDTVKFMIPVDLRNYDRKDKIIGNLISSVFLEVNKEDNSNVVAGKLLSALKNKEELNIATTKWYNYGIYPEKIRRLIVKKSLDFFKNKNKFFLGGIVSHIGRVSFNNCSKIHIENIVSLPNKLPLVAFSVAIIEYENKTNIAICSYENQIPEDLLKCIIKEIEELE